jgi:very-short-patch-repair endonuclease
MAEQHGLISRKQALAAGIGLKAIERRVTAGRWRSVQPGVYAPRSAPASWHQRLLAAVMCGGRGALASHRAAAALWRLDGIDERLIEISIPAGRRIRGAVVHRRSTSGDPRIVNLDHIPATGIERTIIDLAVVVPIDRVALAMDDALRRRRTSRDRLALDLDSLKSRGRTGSGAIRRLLEQRGERDSMAESRLEASLLRLLRSRRIPLPEPQYRVVDGGTVLARLDFAYPTAHIGIETDGYRWHGGRERWARDMRRENRLKLLGWTLLRFSWEDVNEHPELVAGQIKAALEGTHLVHPSLKGVDEMS